MGITKLERLRRKREREAREEAWRAEHQRVRKLEAAFEALPDGEAKTGLKITMTNRIVELWNDAKYEPADAILEFLPEPWARQLLDWYFDEDATVSHPADAAAEEHESAQRGQVQDQPQQPERSDGQYPQQADTGSVT